MPDHRLHRGPHPDDATLFAPERWPDLQSATAHLAWLLSRDYALPSSLKIVGDRFNLTTRQRTAVMRSTCSDASLALRRSTEIPTDKIAGRPLLIDGYNLLTTIEATLGNAVLLRGRDACIRDLASMHGHYKRVEETAPALTLIAQTLAALHITHAHFLLDAPVSNSGRLKTMMQNLATENALPWTITLVPDPDPLLAQSQDPIATADSVILDGTRNPKNHHPPQWLNLAHVILTTHLPSATIIPLDQSN
jgi:hypothetical protein